LLGTCCDDCGEYFYPRRTICGKCMSERTRGVELEARGTLYSYTFVHLPLFGSTNMEHAEGYAVGQIDLPEGPRVQSPLAGKQADFLVTVKKIEAAHLPEVNEELAKSLGIADATVEGLRTDVKKNLEREVKFRLLARNKQAVMDALVSKAELDLPKSSVQAEVDRMIEGARADLKQRGIKDADKAPIPDDVFRPQAERRVRLGLVVAELVRGNGLQAKPEQIKAHIEELAASYEKPADVVRWYYGDNRRLAEVEAIVIENNVTEFVLSKAKINEKAISFDELMGQN